MSYEVAVELPCKGCQTPTNRRERNTRDPICVPCAIKKATDWQIQMSRKSGPHYEEWLAKMRRTFDN